MDNIEKYLTAELQSTLEQANRLKAALDAYRSKGILPASNNTPISTKSEKKKNSSLKDDVYDFIKAKGRFTKNAEIKEGLQSVYAGKDLEKFRSQISGILNGYKKGHKLVSYQYGNGLRDTAWGLTSWVDVTGEPFEKYLLPGDVVELRLS